MTVLTDRTHNRADDQTARPNNRGRHRAEGPALTPFTALTQTAAENAARTGAIAVVTSGMLASVFTQTASSAPAETHTQAALANATPVSNTVDTAPRAGLAENLVTKVKVTQDADFWAERGSVTVTPYAETEAGIAEAKAKAEAEARAKAEAEAEARAEAEAAAAAEAAAEASAEAEAAAVSSSAESSDLGQQAVNLALEYVGVPYVWGGSSPSVGFDCSGLVSYVYGQLGISIPHSSAQISTIGYQVSAANAQPGDIVWTPGHVALYAGDGKVVEAQQAGTPVQYGTMWQDNPVFIRVTG
ncbi:C40 family peptidase [Promicromonospora sp. Populi]|uniref:C40 family peptidase n=1 Tax=Promicromonospora sp. Populi TaxID=3239420 RepID=UPI0034E2713C